MFLTLPRDTGTTVRDVQRFVGLPRDGDQTIPERVRLLVQHRAELTDTLDRPTRHLGAPADHTIDIYEQLLRSQIPSDAEHLKETEPA